LANERQDWQFGGNEPSPYQLGRSLEMTSAETGLLLLKINEPSKDLYDNEGSIEIRIK
jgi:hypothetical protein